MAKAAATPVASNVPEKPNTTVAPVETGGDLANTFDAFEEHAGAGMERLTSKDVLIPRLTIVNALSDQKKRSNVNYIEDCEIGDIVDTATNEIMERPLHFVPVVFDKVFIEWYPRTSNKKGLVKIHKDESILSLTKPDPKGVPTLENGNLIVETAQIYGINIAMRRPCFIAFTSTQLKKVRRWMTLAQGEKLMRRDGSEYVPPLFYRTYMLQTMTESNAQGEWSGWQIDRDVALPQVERYEHLMKQCVDFRTQIIAGLVSGDVGNMTDDPNAVTIDGRGERVDDPNAKM